MLDGGVSRKTEERELAALKRVLAIREAAISLAAFNRFVMPDPSDPDNTDKTLYDPTPQGEFLCKVIEDTASGKRKRTGVSMPPQHGKTLHLSINGLAWLIGKFPGKQFIVATYNETRAGELGADLKTLLESAQYKQVFPDVVLKSDSKSKTSMETTAKSKIRFVGRGGTITGRTADFFIIDDPLKDDEEAGSDGIREKLWKWFFSVAYSRGSNKSAIIILHTRWHEDDLLGRLCDPDHPERERRYKGIAEIWDYINLPAVVTDPDQAVELGLDLKTPTDPNVVEQFGSIPMSALWEKEKGLAYLAQWRQGDARTFDALAMGKPSPDDGVYFLAQNIIEYEISELPRRLRKFGASDHATSEKQRRDDTVLGCVGIDDDNTVWILPDVVMRRMETDKTVEEIVSQVLTHQPDLWWMEDELISKSFGPFLKERMREERAYTTISGSRPSKDKETRARSIQGRVALGTVRFPKHAPWWPRAKRQMLMFPNAANDDFVDFLSLVGMGLSRLHGPGKAPTKRTEDTDSGSINWILNRAKTEASRAKRDRAVAGW